MLCLPLLLPVGASLRAQPAQGQPAQKHPTTQPQSQPQAVTIATQSAAADSPSFSDATLVSNASVVELRAVNELLNRLQNALRARDANALGFFGIAPDTNIGAKNLDAKAAVPRIKMTHLAIAPGGALVRLAFNFPATRSSAPATLGGATGKKSAEGGVAELWLARRGDQEWTISDRHWTAPLDPARKLQEAAADAWNTLPASSLSTGALIDLVAERRGGRWIPLRASNIWTGTLLDAPQLAQTAAQMQSEGGALPAANGSSAPPRQAARSIDQVPHFAPHEYFAVSDQAATARAHPNTWFGPKTAPLLISPRRDRLAPSSASVTTSRTLARLSAQDAKIRSFVDRHASIERVSTAANETVSDDQANESANATASRSAVREATASNAASDEGAPDAPRRAWNVAPWIEAQMSRYETEMAGTAHFLMQNGPRGWVGLDSVWEGNRTLPDAAEKAARQARASLEGDDYLSVVSHRDLARALFATGVYGEAADELQKAAALQPDLVNQAQIARYEAKRAFDPQILAVRQVENEVKIGVAKNHPITLLPALLGEWKSRPSVLCALRISLEYSRLAYDSVSSDWLEQAQQLKAQTRPNVSESDRMWIDLLEEQLQNRRRMAARKPLNIIRSTLFTVRTSPNDLSAVRLLAGLEAAQHTIYADFGIPMSNTEVVLWSNQRDFQRHTGQVSGTATSEFVTALTLTQLVKTESGPEVLSEEINFYTDPRADSLSTIAHEYGHVAVRHLCRGREVPDWINEGVATVVEGGYEDYLPRVRGAAKKNRLLSMSELQAWQIDSDDGERAFLAYSQANSMIDYIKARWGRTALLDLLRQIGEDRAPDDAVKLVLGETTEQLWSDWRREGIR